MAERHWYPPVREWYPPLPDNPEHGHPLGYRMGSRHEDDEFGYDQPLTDEQVEVIWLEEKARREAEERERIAAVRLHPHACGHECTSGGCWVFGLMQSFHCPECAIRLHLL